MKCRISSIPNVIQKLVFDKASAQNFDQAEPVQKQPLLEIGAVFADRNCGMMAQSKINF